MAVTRRMTAKDRADSFKKCIPPSRKCLLLDLPSELRVRIYEYVLYKNDPGRDIAISNFLTFETAREFWAEAPSTCPDLVAYKLRKMSVEEDLRPGPLVFACRQIMSEALAVYFKINTFLLSYGYIKYFEGPTAKALHPSSFGWMHTRMRFVKSINIHNDNDVLAISFNGGLTNYSVQFSGNRDGPGDHSADPSFDEIASSIEGFLDLRAGEALARGRQPVMDMDGLIALIVLLASDESRKHRDVSLSARLVPHAVDST